MSRVPTVPSDCARRPAPTDNPFGVRGTYPSPRIGFGAWLRLYRLRDWERKIANTRLLGYAALGYAIAGQWRPLPLLANTAALLGLVMFQGALNDYWDARVAGERNWLGAELGGGRLTARQALSLAVAPLLLTGSGVLGLVCLHTPRPVLLLLAVGALLAVAYSTPPLRLKTRRPWGVLVAPMLTTLMFLEAHLTLAPLTATAWLLASLLACFQIYAECLQIVADSPASAVKCSPARALAFARRLPGISTVLALCYSFSHPVFWCGVVGGLLRWRAVAREPLTFRTSLRQRRGTLWNPLFGAWEFVGYLGWGLWHGVRAL